MIDPTLFTKDHIVIFAAEFIALTVFLAYAARTKRKYVGWAIAAAIMVGGWPYLPAGLPRIGFVIAALLTIIAGRQDEAAPKGPVWQFLWQTGIVVVILASGWAIPYISNPITGGIFDLRWVTAGTLVFPGTILAGGWLLLLMNAVNWLDGADGLAGSVTLVGFIALASVAMLPSIFDSNMLGLALSGAAAMLAFVIWNFPPARVYLGTAGSWSLGLFIGLVALYGGGKIATGSLILAIPLFDFVLVAARRLSTGRKVWAGDTVSHIHYRLLREGIPLSHIILAAVVVTAWLGLLSIILPTYSKIIVLCAGGVGTAIAVLRLWQGRHTMKG